MWMSLLASSGCAASIASARSSVPCHVLAAMNSTRRSAADESAITASPSARSIRRPSSPRNRRKANGVHAAANGARPTYDGSHRFTGGADMVHRRILLLTVLLSLGRRRAGGSDRRLRRRADEGVPRARALARRREDGKIVKARATAWPNVARGTPATPETVYKIGSVSKQFIATGIMLLVQEGRLEGRRSGQPDISTARRRRGSRSRSGIC